MKDDVFGLVGGMLTAESTYAHYHIKQKKYLRLHPGSGFFTAFEDPLKMHESLP